MPDHARDRIRPVRHCGPICSFCPNSMITAWSLVDQPVVLVEQALGVAKYLIGLRAERLLGRDEGEPPL
jgi:hypothetical protein